ncbi:hypothetical protein KF840_22145 [bacterium]|nr:hypothetical protein [bacterium]
MRRRGLLAVGALALLAAGCDARLPDPDSPGARLYADRCGGCHRIYAPGSLTAAMWDVTVQRMQGELARRGVPPLSRDEQRALLAYLTQHSTGRDQP